MHILILPSWYPSRENSISGVFFREQALALHRAGHKVGIICQKPHSIKKIIEKGVLPSISVEVDNGISTYRVNQLVPFRLHTDISKGMLRLMEWLVYQLYQREQGRPDVIHAHSLLYGGYLAAAIKRKTSIPVVMTEHSSVFQRRMLKPGQEKAIQAALRETDAVCAVSQTLADALQGYVPEKKIHIVGNLVDTDFFVCAEKGAQPGGSFVFTSIANLTANKGIDILLQAFLKICLTGNYVLNIGGGGPEMENLKQQAVSLGIAGCVKFLGPVSREQARELLQGSHSLVSTSYVETFGVTLIEALACGKPVISTRSGGPQDIVNDANGILVPPGDVDALAGAMRKMVDTYHNYDPQSIRADCLARFSSHAVVSRLEKIYCSLV